MSQLCLWAAVINFYFMRFRLVKIGLENEFSFINFYFKNECKNEFQVKNKKSCSLFNVGPRNGHADHVDVNCHVDTKILRFIFE